MGRIFLMLWIAIGCAFLLAGCQLLETTSSPTMQQESSSDLNETAFVPSDPIELQLKEMTLTEKIGQLVIVGIDGTSLNSSMKIMIDTYKVGGFIFFKRNIQDTNQARLLINELKDYNSTNSIPLFFSVDEEGGRVTRMPDEFLAVPPNREIGNFHDEDLSLNIGSAIARKIKAFGFNMNFAPVLDINSNPQNPVIGDRSFGASPETVSKLGIATMKGIQSENVIPVIKHFPGHGDTSTDSHLALPVLTHSLERLAYFEMLPFHQAIKEGAEVVMVAHILLPEVDPQFPASLSKPIITDILRHQLQFEGIVITDDLTMGAITETYSISEAAVRSIQAGSDIVLIGHDYDKQTAVLHSLQQAVTDGEIPIQAIDSKVYRILKLKKKYQLVHDPLHAVDIDRLNRDLFDVLQPYFK